MTILRLTPAQAEALCDRLWRPECIADAIAECEPHRDLINARCRLLAPMVATGRVDLSKLDALDRDILVDAHDGSTWFPLRECDLADDPRALARAKRTVITLRERMAAAGLPVGNPVIW